MGTRRRRAARCARPDVRSTAYTVVRDGDNGLALLTFDTASGETLDQDALPEAFGSTAGTSVGPGGEVLTPTLIGELFVLK